ncbi:winged helix-turn-helix domain-containing protein [Plantactinospora sp. B5E13]|uniref:winged helix-turn-helix domain-containing protein n=1 Tax=unclassified Plantactinospora TaxID=2631981 RepID=UPI00325E4635
MAIPLHQQVANDIAEQIRSGVLKPGDRLPTTRQLMERYEVSETVIWFVMIQLKTERLGYGQQGRGVYVGQEPRSSWRRVSQPRSHRSAGSQDLKP